MPAQLQPSEASGFTKALDSAVTRIYGIEQRIDALPPPAPPQLAPPPQPQATDPERIWGSAAMMFAAVGSLFTRTPMTTALNAAAGVMNAYRQGDMDAAQMQYQQWKQATDYAIKLADFQNKNYLEQLKLADTDMNAAYKGIEALAHAYKDPIMLQLAEQRNLIAMQHLSMDRDKTAQTLELNGEKLSMMHDYKVAEAALEKTPEYMNADPMKQFKLKQALYSKKTGYEQGDGSPQDKRIAESVYKATYPMATVYDKAMVPHRVPVDLMGNPLKHPPPSLEQFYKNIWPTWAGMETPAAGTTKPSYSQQNPARPNSIKEFNALPKGTPVFDQKTGKVMPKMRDIPAPQKQSMLEGGDLLGNEDQTAEEEDQSGDDLLAEDEG